MIKKINLILTVALAICLMAGNFVLAEDTLPSVYQLGFSNADNYSLTLGQSAPSITLAEEGTPVYNYRDNKGPGRNAKTDKPTASFMVSVNGNLNPSDSSTNLDAPTTLVKVNASDAINFTDESQPCAGMTLQAWDIQYRIVPAGTNRTDNPIHAALLEDIPSTTSPAGAARYFAKAIQEAKALNKDCYIEVYLAVADGDNNGSGKVVWSDNGNFATLKTVAQGSPFQPNGNTWYYSSMLIKLHSGGPDFYPLPWGATEYQETFKDCAMTYTADAGTAMNVPISINNSGTQAITDMAATWYGTGWSNPVYTQKDLNIPQGGKQNIQIPVTVPQIGQETRLVIQANTDGKTPASEGNQDNNMLIIKVAPIIPFTDVSVTASASPTNPYNMENSIVTFVITNNGPAVADVTFSAGRMANGDWTITNGGKTQNYTLQPGESQNMTYETASFSAGTSVAYGGIAVVTNTTDSNPNNNMDRVTVTWKARPQPIKLGPGSSDGYLSY